MSDFAFQESKIDASSNVGLKPVIEKGEVEFSNINFVYPTRESVQVRYTRCFTFHVTFIHVILLKSSILCCCPDNYS